MSTPARAVEGLRRHAQHRTDSARTAIEKALRELRRHRQPVNVNAVARRAGVSRKTIYNHPDLLERIRAHTHRPRPVAPEPTSNNTADNSIIAALRHELAAQQARHHTEITELKTLLRRRETELAAVHGELHRLTTHRPPTTS